MIGFRYAWMGPVATGLTIGALAALWHDILSLVFSRARRAQQKTSTARLDKIA